MSLCASVSDLFSDVARGVATPHDAGRLAAHVAGCRTCAARWDEERDLQSALAELAEETATLAAPAVETRLRAAFRQQHAPRWSRVRGLAAAAALVAVGLVWRPSPPPPVEEMRVAVAPPPPAPVTMAAPSPAAPPAVRAARRAPRPRVRPAEQVTPFEPLPWARGLGAPDSVRVVRVRVPRAALVPLGWPASPEGFGDEAVDADLVVGEDGWARAIRFVSETR